MKIFFEMTFIYYIGASRPARPGLGLRTSETFSTSLHARPPREDKNLAFDDNRNLVRWSLTSRSFQIQLEYI